MARTEEGAYSAKDTTQEAKPSGKEVTVGLNDIDMLSKFSHDPDPKTAQKQMSEYKELIKSLRAGAQNSLALEQIRNTERQINRLMHAVTRSKSTDELIEGWTENLHRSEESLLSAQKALRQAQAKEDPRQDSVTHAQLQLQKLAQAKVTLVLSQLAQRSHCALKRKLLIFRWTDKPD